MSLVFIEDPFKLEGNFIKPRSDILCNRFATSPRLTISTNRRGRNNVPDRSRRGCREVGDLAATKSVAARFLNMLKRLAASDLVADRSRQSRRPVPDQSHTNFVRIGAWLSLKLVGDLSATCSKIYSIS